MIIRRPAFFLRCPNVGGSPWTGFSVHRARPCENGRFRPLLREFPRGLRERPLRMNQTETFFLKGKMKKFRWAYVGCGNIAKNTARSVTRGGHIISAVYSRNPVKARVFAGKYKAEVFESFDAMLENGCFDGVYIATPHTSHADYAVRAMRAGKPVLCEKPVGVSCAEAGLMLAAARENGVYFCEAMWTWFSDVALTVKKLIDENRIGKIKSVRIDYAFPA